MIIKLKVNSIIGIILILTSVNLYSQSTKIKNARFEPTGETIIIYYDLEGEPDEKYIIECYLKRDLQKDFKYKLRYVSGDIGEGLYVGRERKIIWNYLREFPLGLTGDDFYFSITVDELSKGLAWYYYVGGAILGGTAAYLIYNNRTDKPNTETYSSYPLRP